MKCAICSSDTTNLKRHITRAHKDVTYEEYFFKFMAVYEETANYIKCEICNTYHATNKFLDWHLKIIHNINSENYYLKYILKLDTVPSCMFCGSKTNFRKLSNGYKKFCNTQCSMNYKKLNPSIFIGINKKRKNTCLMKYGTEYASQTKESKDKMLTSLKKTCQDKYGVDNPMQKHDFKQKTKETMLRKYNVDNASKCPEFQTKKINTMLEKYGETHSHKTNQMKERIKNTCLEKYGETNPMKVDAIKETLKLNNIKKYNTENWLHSKHARRRMEKLGLWMPYNTLSDLKKYRSKVMHYTRKNEKNIENIHRKGKIYHVDHKFSISEGFKQGILPHIIGSKENLEVILARDNFIKKDKCSITLKTLLDNIKSSC